jgi:membrane-bound acyltransferase YfiQ involved in biofilm formation
MTAYLLLNHIVNFLAPAAGVALLLVLFSRVFSRFLASKRPLAQSISAQAAIIFIVNVIVLVAGLVFFGNDGKMATYAAMVLAAAVCQWVLWRGWRA